MLITHYALHAGINSLRAFIQWRSGPRGVGKRTIEEIDRFITEWRSGPDGEAFYGEANADRIVKSFKQRLALHGMNPQFWGMTVRIDEEGLDLVQPTEFSNDLFTDVMGTIVASGAMGVHIAERAGHGMEIVGLLMTGIIASVGKLLQNSGLEVSSVIAELGADVSEVMRDNSGHGSDPIACRNLVRKVIDKIRPLQSEAENVPDEEPRSFGID